jgi:hypothetical protein
LASFFFSIIITRFQQKKENFKKSINTKFDKENEKINLDANIDIQEIDHQNI